MVDRAQVIAEAERHWAVHGTSGTERLHFQAGDLLPSAPSAQNDRDVYLLCAVLHGFDNDTCVTVLRNLADATRSTGARVALLDMVLREVGADLAGASFDMQMFVGSRGRERTLREWTSLFDRSGMALGQVVGLRSAWNILVLLPTKNTDPVTG